MKTRFQHILVAAGFALLAIPLLPLSPVHKTGFNGVVFAMDGGGSEQLFNLSRSGRAISKRNWAKKSGANGQESRALSKAKAKLKRLRDWRERLQTALERAQARLARLREETKRPMGNREAKVLLGRLGEAKADIKAMKSNIRTADKRIAKQERVVKKLTPL